jgi:hypothetical protein
MGMVLLSPLLGDTSRGPKTVTVETMQLEITWNIFDPPIFLKNNEPVNREELPVWFDALKGSSNVKGQTYAQWLENVTPEYFKLGQFTEDEFKRVKEIQLKPDYKPSWEKETLLHEIFIKKDGVDFCIVGQALDAWVKDISPQGGVFMFFVKRNGKWLCHDKEDWMKHFDFANPAYLQTLLSETKAGGDEKIPYKQKTIDNLTFDLACTRFYPPLFLFDNSIKNRSETAMLKWYGSYRSFYSLRDTTFDQWIQVVSPSYVKLGHVTKQEFDDAKKLREKDPEQNKCTVFYETYVRWKQNEICVLGQFKGGWIETLPEAKEEKISLIFFVKQDGTWKRHILKEEEDWIAAKLPIFDINQLAESIKADKNQVDAGGKLQAAPHK